MVKSWRFLNSCDDLCRGDVVHEEVWWLIKSSWRFRKVWCVMKSVCDDSCRRVMHHAEVWWFIQTFCDDAWRSVQHHEEGVLFHGDLLCFMKRCDVARRLWWFMKNCDNSWRFGVVIHEDVWCIVACDDSWLVCDCLQLSELWSKISA